MRWRSRRTIRTPSCASWSTRSRACGTVCTTASSSGTRATLAAVAEGHELVYVPCHRSHMDYLLLGYAIYVQGYAVPHTAAGVNLNLPIIGRFLRKGGAFFIRRSFRGNALYTVGAHEVSRDHHGARAPDRVLHRGRPQPHRAAAAAEDRHARDDGAQLPAASRCARWCSCRCTSATSAWWRAAPTSASSPGAQGEGERARAAAVLARAARAFRQGVREPRRADRARCASRCATTPRWRAQRFDDDTRSPWVVRAVDDARRMRSCATSTPRPR